MNVASYTKAIVAAIGAGYAVFQVATGDGSPAGAGVTVNEWVQIIVTALALGITVWGVPNTLTPDQVNTAVAKAAAAAAGAVVVSSRADPPGEAPDPSPVGHSANLQT